MMNLKAIVLNIIFAVLVNSDNSSLISVVVVFRHGERIPTTFAPNDPYSNPKLWPEEMGELSNRGIRQQYELGKWLRQRYSNFLPTKYVAEDIYVRSSDIPRCLMSAEANLAGLYPPAQEQIWNNQLLWRPLPVHTVPISEDIILEIEASCPMYTNYYNDVLNNDKIKQIDKDNAGLYSYLSRNLGVSIKSFIDTQPYYDTMFMEDLYRLSLPQWTKKVYPQPMKLWSDLTFTIDTYNRTLTRFATGFFFETLALHFDAALNNSKENLLAKKMVMFSGHQTNICDISNALGVFRSGSYASALIFELRNYTKPFVNILYKTESEIETLKLENCTVNCEKDSFLGILEPIRVNKTQLIRDCAINF